MSNPSFPPRKTVSSLAAGSIRGDQLGEQVTEFHMGESFYADDGAFLFERRDDAEETLNIMYPEFKRFGMQIHIGRNGVRSKTEALFVPHSRSSLWRMDLRDLPKCLNIWDRRRSQVRMMTSAHKGSWGPIREMAKGRVPTPKYPVFL